MGGKSRIAPLVWARLGDTPNYVEPFMGSAAVLLARPDAHDWANRIETVNDADGYIANFWRATQHDPDMVAWHADNPVNENDLRARDVWLRQRAAELELPARLEGDPAFYDAQVAGWWVWGMACWIGPGRCYDPGPCWPDKEG